MADNDVKKKRGRKPKGGKIVPNMVSTDDDNVNKQNVILHLKCNFKDLDFGADDSYNFTPLEKDNYEAVAPVNNTKDVWRKLKAIEHNLHSNEIAEHKRSCFWCTCGYETQPVHIPRSFINKSYQVYGSFCSPECAAGYLMDERIDSSMRFERYQMLNHIYGNNNGVYQNVKPAPNPRYLLDKFSGSLNVQEYRSLFKTDKMFYMADKPLTRIMPEYHEESFESSANNKVAPINSLQQKTKPKIQRAPQSKVDIMNGNFGLKQTT